MAVLLKQAIYEKLQALPEWRSFCSDFESITGLEVGLVDDLGLGFSCRAPLCGLVARSPTGGGLCRRFRRALMEKSAQSGRAEAGSCDAGAWEAVVPIRISGVVSAYLVVGGMVDGPETGRVVHLLSRAGVLVSHAEVRETLDKSRQVPAKTREACLRWLEMAARELASRLTAQSPQLPRALPPPVESACRWARSHALEGPVRLEDAAKFSSVSPAHLSRLFRRSTGLTFTDFVSRLRAAAARDMLLHTGKSVTEAALESGFSSVSQFYRVFRRIYGATPKALRSRQTADTRGRPGP